MRGNARFNLVENCANFGDCFAYDVAKEHGCRLLYVGGYFAKTDIEGAS